MNATGILRFGLLLLLLGAGLAGCTVQSQKDTSIPWAQPNAWENTLPGMEDSVH